jgi:hypothetical protein
VFVMVSLEIHRPDLLLPAFTFLAAIWLIFYSHFGLYGELKRSCKGIRRTVLSAPLYVVWVYLLNRRRIGNRRRDFLAILCAIGALLLIPAALWLGSK